MSLFVNLHNKKKCILILHKCPLQGLQDTKLTAEKEYTINFIEQHKKNCLSLHYKGVNKYLFVNTMQDEFIVFMLQYYYFQKV